MLKDNCYMQYKVSSNSAFKIFLLIFHTQRKSFNSLGYVCWSQRVKLPKALYCQLLYFRLIFPICKFFFCINKREKKFLTKKKREQ